MRPTMPALITFGRVLFAVLFIYLGAAKLFAIQPTADFIASKVTIPSELAPYATQVESATGMSMPQALALAPCAPRCETRAGMSIPQLLAIGAGVLETLAGLMIALNFGARFFSIILIL